MSSSGMIRESRRSTGFKLLSGRSLTMVLGTVVGFIAVSAVVNARADRAGQPAGNPYAFSYLHHQYSCTVPVDPRQLGPLVSLPTGPTGRWLEWAARPQGRPLAVYARTDDQLRACLAPAVNLRTTGLDLRSTSNGSRAARVAVHDEPRLVAGRLRAQLTVTLVRPLGPVTVPLALLRCGKQSTAVPLASRRAARVGKKLGLTLASSTTVPTCRGHQATVQFRIETPSIYLLSAVEALH